MLFHVSPIPVEVSTPKTPMDALAQWFQPHAITLDLDVAGKRDALQAVSAMFERSRGIDGAATFRALWRREMAASTGLGNGFAVPHARIAGITEPLTAYLRTRRPLDFAAADGKHVAELFVILVPADGDNAKHLGLLALVAEAFSDRSFRRYLAAAADAQGVRSAFSWWIDRASSRATDAPKESRRAPPAIGPRDDPPPGPDRR